MTRFGFAMGVLGLVVGLAAAGGGTTVDLGGYKAATPADWKAADIPAFYKQFRLYQFNVGAKEPAEVIVSGPAGGGVGQNIERWKAQFTSRGTSDAEPTKFEVAGVPVTYVEISGTYKGTIAAPGAKVAPKENYRMIGAIFDSDNGPFFIRFVGPAATVAANKSAFDTWLKSFKK